MLVFRTHKGAMHRGTGQRYGRKDRAARLHGNESHAPIQGAQHGVLSTQI